MIATTTVVASIAKLLGTRARTFARMSLTSHPARTSSAMPIASATKPLYVRTGCSWWMSFAAPAIAALIVISPLPSVAPTS